MDAYEFNQLQNKEFLELAFKIKLALGSFLLLALLDTWTLVASLKVLSLLEVLIGIVTVLATFYTVAALWRARGQLIRIAKTEGEDLSLLFRGTQHLENAFVSVTVAIIGHIVGTFTYHEMMYGPYAIFATPPM